jgi:hypothetical protein
MGVEVGVEVAGIGVGMVVGVAGRTNVAGPALKVAVTVEAMAITSSVVGGER